MLTACRSTTMEMQKSPPDSGSNSLRGPAALQAVLDTVAGEMSTAGYSGDDQAAVRVSLREALINALRHGHGRTPGTKLRARWHVSETLAVSMTLKWIDSPQQVCVSWQISSERILIEVDDGGPGFDTRWITDPTAVDQREEPEGRGLLLMRHFMTWVMHNHRGNRVSMWLLRSVG
jgi:serine/threonine-protein kinase RsbW